MTTPREAIRRAAFWGGKVCLGCWRPAAEEAESCEGCGGEEFHDAIRLQDFLRFVEEGDEEGEE